MPQNVTPAAINRSPLAAYCHVGYIYMGAAAALFPAIMPAIVRGFQINLQTAGQTYSVLSMGSLLGGLLAGKGSDRFGRSPFLIGGALAAAVALFAISRAPQWHILLLFLFLLGMAQGGFSIAINAQTLDLNALRHGAALNNLHAFYSLGATFSPFLTAGVLRLFPDWRMALCGASIAWFLLSLFGFLVARQKVPQSHHLPHSESRLRFTSVIGMLIALAFLYNGIAWALIGWVKMYVQEMGNRSETLGSALIAAFYLALTIGRLSGARLTERWGQGRVLILCALGSLCVYPLFLFSRSLFWVGVGSTLSGLFLSAIYPTAIAYGTRRYPDHAGALTGVLSASLALGAILVPWLTGALADRSSLSFALTCNYPLALLLTCCALPLALQDRKDTPKHPP